MTRLTGTFRLTRPRPGPARGLRWLIVWLALALPWAALPAPVARAAETVTQSFAKANKAFSQGQDKAALKILRGIIKKYPDHQPSHLLLGRLYYKNGDIPRAARHFRKVSPDLVNAAVGYEYGITMFEAKNCQRALAGFRRVPKGSRLKPLADFYSGLCDMRARNWDAARDHLEAARGVPQHLEPTRRKALSQVREALRSERRGNFSQSGPYVIVPTPPPPVMLPPEAPGAPPVQGEPAPKPGPPKPPPPPPTGFSSNLTPSLTVTQVASTKDYFGWKDEESESRDTTLKLAFKGKYDAAPRSNGGQPSVSLGLDFAQKQISTRGVTVQYVTTANAPGELTPQETTLPATSATLGILNLTPEGSFPMTKSIDLSGGYTLSETYPDMKQESKSSVAGPYGAVEFGGDSLTLKLTGAQSDNRTEGSPKVTSSIVFGADLTKPLTSGEVGVMAQQTQITVTGEAVPPGGTSEGAGTFDGTKQMFSGDATKKWGNFSLTGTVAYTTWAVSKPEFFFKDGANQTIKAEVSGNKSFEFGGSFSLTASLTQLNDYQKAFDDETLPKDANGNFPKALVKTNGTAKTVVASFKLAPFDWIYGLASYVNTQQAFELSDPKFQTKFETGTPEVSSDFTLQVGLSKSF